MPVCAQEALGVMNPGGRMSRQYISSLLRPKFLGLAAATLLTLGSTQGSIADTAEPLFNPPVGSRWIVETKRDTIETRPEGKRASQIATRAELIFEAKTADGFRITYRQLGTTAGGDDPRLPLILSAAQALDNVPVRAITDMSGKPLRVENLDEAKAAIRVMASKITEPYQSKPQIVALLNQIMVGFIEVDAEAAARTYLDDLPQLAIAQNTGMKQGEARYWSDTALNPLGGALKTSSTFTLSEVDTGGGRRVFVTTTTYDPASVKEVIQALSGRAAASTGNATPDQIESVVRQMAISLERSAVYEVEGGMTRRITDKSVTVARAMGRSLEKTETRTITVSPAP